MDQKNAGLNITIFYCQQIDPDQDMNRRAFEKELGKRTRFSPCLAAAALTLFT